MNNSSIVQGSTFNRNNIKSKFIQITIKNKKYTKPLPAIINTWGVKNQKDRVDQKIYGRIQEKSRYLSFYARATKIEPTKFILGIPTIIIGESIWGPKTGLKLGQIKKYKKIKILNKFSFKAKGFANFVYDIWLTKNKQGTLKKGDVELMVWLDYTFEPPHTTIYEDKNYKIKHTQKKDNGSHVYMCFIKNKTPKIDIIQLIKKIKIKLDNYYLRSIDIGTEFSKNTTVEAKVYGIKMDLE